jgi:hypothetical protein
MTKEKHSITLSKELSEATSFLASAKQMNLSEYLESRLRMIPEIQKQIDRFEDLPEDPILDMNKINKSMPKQIENFAVDTMINLTKNIA